MLAIINYGIGNLRSVQNMLRKAQVECCITSDEETIRRADRLILPGVGNFGHGMAALRETGLVPTLDWFALEACRPVLGICLGSQIIGRRSEEGAGDGLGWIDMECVRFPKRSDIRVPHMRWNTIDPVRRSALLDGVDDETRYYFVHSYYMKCADEADVLCTTEHGLTYTSGVSHGNIFGVQFHPEKSLRHGLKLLEAFSRI